MKSIKKGKVWLVGAGPGDAGLLTLRGREVLGRAEVVVYDRLIGPGIAGFFPRNADLVYVGKRVGDHVVVQEEIEAILLREARAGKRVVRLKGGDPFLFGRGGEEALSLMAHGIEVEIVPGVTSAISVPAYAGIPVTHRSVSGGVYVVAAHRTNGDDGLDYAHLAVLNDTLVILMGAGRIGAIAQKLIAAGRDAATPVAVVQKGTTADMKRISGTLATIAELAQAHGIDAPAVIVVGFVAGLATKLDWHAALPLARMRVWLTETRKDAEEGQSLASMLRDAGSEVAHLPCIETEPTNAVLPCTEVFSRASWLVFSSRVGVACFFAALRREGRDVRAIGGARIAAVGPSTAAALAERGLRVDFVPEIHDGEHLAKGLAAELETGTNQVKILLFRCEGEPPAWSAILREAGADVSQMALYRTIETPSPLLASIAPGDVVVFKSASAVEVCALAMRCERSLVRAVCIGAPSGAAAKRLGFDVYAAPRASDEALFEVVLSLEKPDPGAPPQTPLGDAVP